ncbi:MAG: hypothetical protein KIT14_03820 [bacterium]|nr:hypothetical protein [bacterium]
MTTAPRPSSAAVVRIAGGVALALAVAVHGAEPGPLVRMDGDRLSARLADVPPAEMLELLRSATGAEVRGAGADPAPVSVAFDDLPLDEGLVRLFGSRNFTVVFGDDGRVRRVTLLGATADEPPPVIAPAVAAAPPAVPVVPPSPHRLLNRSVALPVGSRIARHMGTAQATLQQLLDVALHDPDASLRAEAVRAGLGGVELQDDLRATMTQALAGVDDDTLRELVERLARERAPEIAEQVATTSRIPELRERSRAVLRDLAAIPPAAP